MITGRILIAADDPDGRNTISNILSCMGLDVAVAESGTAAYQMALSAWESGQSFDLVLLDTQLPELDGYESTALLRSVGYNGRIVALASCGFGEIHHKCALAGCDGYTTKPITHRMLGELLDQHLRSSASIS